jgi:hypothetical protein
MQTHRIVFRFEGRDADRGFLDASDLVSYSTATRQLLALHAYFLTRSVVPNGGVPNQTPAYRVYGIDARHACYEGVWGVDIFAEEAAKEFAKHALRKAGRYLYETLLKDSLEPILRRRASSMPPEMRVEPVLPGLDRGNAPVFDVESEHDHRWGQLRERATIIMPHAFRPVGRSADTLVITGDNLRITTIDRQTMLRLFAQADEYLERRAARQGQITDALQRLNLRGGALS